MNCKETALQRVVSVALTVAMVVCGVPARAIEEVGDAGVIEDAATEPITMEEELEPDVVADSAQNLEPVATDEGEGGVTIAEDSDSTVEEAPSEQPSQVESATADAQPADDALSIQSSAGMSADSQQGGDGLMPQATSTTYFVLYNTGELKMGANLSTANSIAWWYVGAGYDYSGDNGNPPWLAYSSQVKKVTVTSRFKVTNCGSLFFGMDKVTSMDLSKLDVSACANFHGMFYSCQNLKSLDLSSWNTSKATDMGSMFADCRSLTTLRTTGWNTSNVTNMAWMFIDCRSIPSIDLASWNVSKVQSMAQMFYDCPSLKSLDLSRWSSPSLRTTWGMFMGCASLQTLDFSGLDTSLITDWPSETAGISMFKGCTALTKWTVGAKFNLSRDCPPATASNGKWYSTKAKKWFTSAQISSGRAGIADTYTSAQTASTTRSLTSAKVTATIPTQAWTGKQVKPTPTVKWGDTILKKGTHFKVVSYGENKNTGTTGNWVKIQGIGSYTGTRTVVFRIVSPKVSYYVHRQTYGWEDAWSASNGTISGTTGESKRLEGIRIKLATKPVAGSIAYRTHIQTYGWESGWKRDGAMSGTTGESKRLEAIQIKLTGDMVDKYDVWYRVHAQHFGWMGWAKNGQSAGTAGYSYRLEAIQVVLRPKGSSAPAATYKGATRATSAAFKQQSNDEAHMAFLQKVKAIARNNTRVSFYHTAYYRFADIYGDSTDELLVSTHELNGSEWTLRIYRYANAKVIQMSEGNFYGDIEYRFYKETSGYMMHCGGHGHESYAYMQAIDGEYVHRASKARTSAAFGGVDGAWNYYAYASSSKTTKATYDKIVSGIAKGAPVTLGSSYEWQKITV